MLFQYRNTAWGYNASKDFTADPELSQDQFRMRLAYIDWTIPTTEVKVRMGRQALVTPSYAFGSAILDGRGDAVTVTAPVNDNITLGAGWMRLDSAKKGGFKANDDTDAVMLQAEFAYDGWKVAPWAMYINKGAKAAMDMGMSDIPFGADAFVIGASAELSMFDPFVFAIDALYNNISYNDGEHIRIPAGQEDSFDGFYVGAKASYKFSNGIASLGGWYASGSDYKNNDKGFVLLDGGFNAATILYGDNIIGADDYNTLTGDTPFGTWGLIAEYANFSFMEKLTHTARVVYVQGTNENAPGKRTVNNFAFDNITEDDSLVEFDFNSTYEIYKNFAATLELGYVLVDQSNLAAGVEEQDDIFRTGLTFVYNF